MSGEKKKTKVFLLLGLLVFALIATYKVVFFASYLNVDQDEVVFEWTGGEQNIYVSTDARSWIVEDDENVYWASFSNWGSTLHIYAYNQNNSKEDRSAYIKIRSGSIKGLGNEWRWLRVVQKGKQATYLNASKQTVSFSERGSSESLRISTDGEWYVVDRPNWIKSGPSGETLTLWAEANNGRTSREGVVRVKADTISVEIKVIQSGVVKTSPPRSGNGNKYVFINATELRLRYGPSLSADTFKWPDGTNRHPNKGEMFKYLGESGDFYKIDFHGNALWVSHINNYSYIMYR